MLSALAVAVAAGLDLATGEPPDRVHPVAWFGRAVAPVDRSWPHPRAAGVLAAAVMPLAAAALVAGLVGAVAAWRPPAGVGLAGVVLFVATSLRRLLAVAREVTAATKRDLPRARENLRALAGRDASALSAGEVRSAVVESLAENLADGLVAPLGAFALGAAGGAFAGSTALALALGSAGAVWVKAVNTMDSMLGYRSKPVGWGAARLDDAVMCLPARTTAILLAAVCLAPGSLVRAREWVDGVPSPNSGWPMSVIAAALGVSLVKPSVYELPGGSDLPTIAAADSARRRVAAAGGLAYLLAGVVAWG